MRIGRTAFIVFASKFLGSLLGFLATIYFARILGAEILGYYAVTIALVSWLKLGGTLGISSAITKRISEGQDVYQFFTAGAISVTFFGLIASAGVLLFPDLINSYIGSNVSLFIIPLVLSGLFMTLVRSVLNGEKKVHLAGVLTPVNIMVSRLSQVSLVFLEFGLIGMLGGYLIGEIVVGIIGSALVSVGMKMPREEHFRSLFKYAKYSWIGGLKSQSFNDVDIVVLSAFVNPSLVGIYSVAWSISQFLTLFGKSVRRTLFPEISSAEAEDDLERISQLTHDSLAYIGLISIPGFFGSLVVGDLLLQIYGGEFVQGRLILSLLILAVLIYSYQQQLSGILNGMDRPDIAFRINALFIVLNIFLNIFLISWIGWVGAAVATVLSTAVGSSVAFWRLRQLIEFKIPFFEIGAQIGMASVMALSVWGGRRIIESNQLLSRNYVIAFSLICFGASVYFIGLLMISPRFREVVSNNLPSSIPL